MTISKEKFKELVIDVTSETDAKYPWNMNEAPWIEFFALALIKRVEAESDIAEHLYTYTNDFGEEVTDISIDRQGSEYTSVPLIALPLVGE